MNLIHDIVGLILNPTPDRIVAYLIMVLIFHLFWVNIKMFPKFARKSDIKENIDALQAEITGLRLEQEKFIVKSDLRQYIKREEMHEEFQTFERAFSKTFEEFKRHLDQRLDSLSKTITQSLLKVALKDNDK